MLYILKHFFFCPVDDSVYLIGDFIRGEFDVVYKGLLGLVSADVHHLKDGEFEGEVHIGNATVAGCVGGTHS